MSQTALKPASDRQRKALYAKIAAARKALGIEEDAYRDLLAARYEGARSAKDLSVADLDDLVGHFKAMGWTPAPPKSRPPVRSGARVLADRPEAKKARALWISLYHLGVVRDPSERALAAFGKRMTGVQALQWIHGDFDKVIEALKGMATREAGVDWLVRSWEGNEPPNPRVRVIEAQWSILVGAGQATYFGRDGYACRVAGVPAEAQSIMNLRGDQLDRVIEALGPKVRAVKATAGADRS